MAKKSKKILGIEFGSKTLKIVEVSGNDITQCIDVDLPENVDMSSREGAFSAIPGLLSETLNKYKISTKDCSIIIPDEYVSLKRIKLAYMTHQQLITNLPFEFADVLSSAKDNYIFDYRTIKVINNEQGEPSELDIFAAAVNKHIIERYKNLLKGVGLNLYNALPHEFALSSLADKVFEKEEKKDIAILDLGYSSTKLFIFEKGLFEITRTLDTGLSNAVDIYADKNGISKEAASNYFKTNKNDIQNSDESLEVYINVATDVMQALTYYFYEKPDNTIDTLYYCGGASVINRFVYELRTAVDVMVNPLSDLMPSENHEAIMKAPAAVGLCFDSQKKVKKYKKKDVAVDKDEIMLVDHKEEETNQKAVYVFFAFIPILLIFAYFGVLRPFRKLDEARRAYMQMQNQIDNYNSQIKDFDKLQERYDMLTDKYLNEEELALIDRKEMYKMIDENILKYVDLESITIKDNKLDITTAPTQWPIISNVVQILTTDPRISYVTTSYTQNKEKKTDDITANIVLLFVGGDGNGTVQEEAKE